MAVSLHPRAASGCKSRSRAQTRDFLTVPSVRPCGTGRLPGCQGWGLASCPGPWRASAMATVAEPLPQSPIKPTHNSSMLPQLRLEPGLEDRAVGCLLGAMCGNVLAAPVAHDRHWQVIRLFPYGLTEFWGNDLGDRPVSLGQATGEFQVLLAVAHSLASAQTCDATSIAQELAARCDPATRRYNPHTAHILNKLRAQDANLTSLHFLANLPVQAAQQYAQGRAQAVTSFSDRKDREPWGPADNGAASCVAPVAVAYHTCAWPVVDQAVQELCLPTHSHPVGIDGARVMAAAVHWLLHCAPPSQSSPTDPAAGPQALLTHLQSVAQTEDMRSKLALIQQRMFQVAEVTSWQAFYRSREWSQLTRVVADLTYHDYATAGTEATAVALWALVTNWSHPKQAVCMSAMFGGSVPVTTQMTGALVGALNGREWIPESWWSNLENDQPVLDQFGGVVPSAGGSHMRDEAEALAKQLASVRCSSVGLHTVSLKHQ